VSARIIVHSLEHATAAVAAAASLARSVTLMSAPGTGCSAGPLWFLALVAEAARAYPDADISSVLDCADEPGSVLAALRAGCKLVRYCGPPAAGQKLVEIAAGANAEIESGAAPPALDLLDVRDPEAACRAYLSP
jgi:hypothetical protein